MSSLPKPEPSAGIAAYEAERGARLALYPSTLENWRKYQAGRGKAEVDYLPVKLDVENVSRCNFACTMCAVSKWHKGTRAADMSLECFKRLIDEQVGLVEIKLNGLGEALLQGDDYFEMIRYARARRIWVRMTTNASLLHLRENYKKLVDAGPNEIDISIDGADATTFEGIRVQGKFGMVTQNCATLNAYLARRGLIRTKMWTLVQKGNVEKLGSHVRLAAELGFRHLVFSLQMHGWGDPALEKRNHDEQAAVGEDEAWWLVEMGHELGVRVSFWDVSQKFEPVDGKRCGWPFERAVVTSDLRTVPCCMVGDPDAFEFGRGSGKTFLENWQGDEYRAFRQSHLDGKIPSICRACYKND